MSKLDLLDVVRLAREFSEEAGWGFFKVVNIGYDVNTGRWTLTANLGSVYGKIVEFIIDDNEGKVIGYGPPAG